MIAPAAQKPSDFPREAQMLGGVIAICAAMVLAALVYLGWFL